MKPFVLALLAFSLFHRSPAVAVETSMDAALARLNQQVSLGPLRITPIAVLKDARCIENPVESCFVSNAVVRVLVEQDGKTAWLDIHLGGMKRWGGHAIAIAAIKPERRNNAPIPGSAYQISLRRISADVRNFE